MQRDKLPEGLQPKGSSATFTRDTLPDALCNEHQLGKNRWGALHILEGSVVFIDLANGEERDVVAPGVVIIAPESPHKLQLRDGAFSCRVDFFQDLAADSTEK